MKSLLVCAVFLFADVLLASPITYRTVNDPFAEVTRNVDPDNSNHRWSLIPDSEGRMHLVDLNPVDMESVEPRSIPEEDVIFILHTRANPTVGQVITNNVASIQNSNFNPNNPTRVTIHGWLGTNGSEVNVGVNSAYFQLGDFNMITVDWSIGASPINYITARNRVQDHARWVAEFIDFLHLNNFVRFEELHAIGHSLGGQMVGLIGKAVTRGRIQVIYPLDPAGPLFSLDNPNERVAPTDGVYVEVMHTNGGLLGFREPLGQADFFPNYGRTQPGCGADVSGQCAHARTVLFYAESINSPFTSHECTSFEEIDNGSCTRTGRTALMGGARGNIGLTGNFVVYTNDAAPFSMG